MLCQNVTSSPFFWLPLQYRTARLSEEGGEMVLWAVVAFLAAGAVAASEFSVVVEDASPESSEEVSAAEVPSPRRRFTIHRRPPLPLRLLPATGPCLHVLHIELGGRCSPGDRVAPGPRRSACRDLLA